MREEIRTDKGSEPRWPYSLEVDCIAVIPKG
jgi:hypothetical protein